MANYQALSPLALITSFLLVLGPLTTVDSEFDPTYGGEIPEMSQVKKVIMGESKILGETNVRSQKCVYNHGSSTSNSSNSTSHCRGLTIDSGDIACTECSDRGDEERCSDCGTVICAGSE